MSEICVVHLIGSERRLDWFSRFVDSYRKNSGGVAHDLLLVFNGFASDADTLPFLEVLGDRSSSKLLVPTASFDINGYFAAARAVEARFVCFLNSHSVFEDQDWLAKLHAHVSRAEVGIAGATGSYESLYSTYREASERYKGKPLHRALAFGAGRVLARLKFAGSFDPFPNPHIRTNAFMLDRRRMLDLDPGFLRSKIDAHRFECGKRGMTRRIVESGLGAVVVGKDGQAYEVDRWFESATFRSGDQRNLLVSDNRTRLFAAAAPSLQRRLSFEAWGQHEGPGIGATLLARPVR
jgi:hypothetical protein